jgi:hypothetical protein
MKKAIAICAILASPAGALAAEVNECDDFRSSAHAIAEPWADNTRTFAKGDIRIAVMDTIEPAAGSYFLLVISPPYDEVGSNRCKLISASGSIGFSGMDLGGLVSGYDSRVGLALAIPVQRYNWETDMPEDVLLTVNINQKTGKVIAGYDRF